MLLELLLDYDFYFYGDKRIIPFKDHINIEADGLVRHVNDFAGCKFTPKGMLQIKTNQVIDLERLKIVFSELLSKQ